MRTFVFDKLVRDGIPQNVRSQGGEVKLRELDRAGHLQALKVKIVEESQEIPLDDPEEATKELADLQEILDCMAALMGIEKSAVAEAQVAKRAKSGSFMEGLYVETVSVPDVDPMVEYYVHNVDRYPEVPKR